MSGFFAQPRAKKVAPAPPKKRKTTHAVEEITFDKDARAEYLTGFGKRKQARIKAAQVINEKMARDELIRMRKKIREERKQAVEEHVQTINKILREARESGVGEQDNDGSDDEWQGLPDAEVQEEPPIDLEEEYIDEDKYTTVTVEAVNVDRDGLHKPRRHESPEEGAEAEGEAGKQNQEQDSKGPAKKTWDPKKKKPKFRYESKFDRKVTTQKERAKRNKRRD